MNIWLYRFYRKKGPNFLQIKEVSNFTKRTNSYEHKKLCWHFHLLKLKMNIINKYAKRIIIILWICGVHDYFDTNNVYKTE